MKNGSARFEFFLAQLQVLLATAKKQKNPGLWLYQNNMRTPLFMLEGLSKVYSGIHNAKKFSKLKEHFKVLEDMLGTIDYYDGFAKTFAANPNVPVAIVNYLQAQTREKIQSLNEVLAEDKWLGDGADRIKKIQKKLSKADWLKEAKEIKALNDYYGKAIYGIAEFICADKLHFDNVENDVHELRRKLRWLSIYPQAFQGCIQLSKTAHPSADLTAYLTPEIVGSPYNKMPDAGDCKYFLLLSKDHFYALSWMIAEMGKLKDSGLGIIAIKEALQQAGKVKDEAAYNKAYGILGETQPRLQEILRKAAAVCTTYFDEQNLEQLVIGTVAAK